MAYEQDLSPRVLSRDPITGIREIFVPINNEGDFHIVTQQDHEPIMQSVQDERNLHRSKAWQKWKGDMHKVASIPMPVWNELCRLGIAFDERELRKWLDDPDQKVFRTKPGRLSR